MKINRFFTIVVCCSIMTTLIGCSIQNANVEQKEKSTVQVSVDYPYYPNLDALTEKADLIIEGTVLDSRIEEIDTRVKINEKDEILNPGGDEVFSPVFIYTVYTIKVSDSYKGNVKPGETIEIKQLGGEGETVYIKDVGEVYIENVEENVKFVKNKKYILFLSAYESIYPSLLNPIQSAYYAIADSNVEKEPISVNAKNELMLTIEDLQEIKNK